MKRKTLRVILRLCDMVDDNMCGRGDAFGMALQADAVRKCLKREMVKPDFANSPACDGMVSTMARQLMHYQNGCERKLKLLKTFSARLKNNNKTGRAYE